MDKIILSLLLSIYLCSCQENPSKPISSLNSKMEEFKWDFSQNKEITYALTQEETSFRNYHLIPNQEQIDTTKSILKGQIILKIHKDKDMSFCLDSLKSKIFRSSWGEKRNEKEDIHRKQLYQGFDKYGKNELNPNVSKLIMDFFPLPYGEKCNKNYYELKTSIPFNAFGSMLKVNGLKKFTITDSLNIKGHQCVKIESEIVYNDIENSEDLEGTYFCNKTAIFWGYYDYIKGFYIEGHNTMYSKIYAKTMLPDHDNKLSEKVLELENTLELNFSLIE